jgi:hypothetical protein
MCPLAPDGKHIATFPGEMTAEDKGHTTRLVSRRC